MEHKVFKTLFREKADFFESSFSKTSRSLFYDENKKSFTHPGEFGIYREKICKDFLRFFIPQRLEIEDGFVISSNGETSTQCDLVIYDKSSTPLIQSNELQKFFPIETVVGVGEIKSKLSFSGLKEALGKLSEIKKIRQNINNPLFIYPSHKRKDKYNPDNSNEDQIFTFLICEKFEFNYFHLVDQFKDIYKDIRDVYKHNLILSVEDGLIFCYLEGEESPCPYPIFNNSMLKNIFVSSINEENKYFHLEIFAQHLNTLATNHAILYPNMFAYMGSYLSKGKLTKED